MVRSKGNEWIGKRGGEEGGGRRWFKVGGGWRRGERTGGEQPGRRSSSFNEMGQAGLAPAVHAVHSSE
jgi:hypothetical protein